MTRMIAEDGAMIDLKSHWDLSFISGRRFPKDIGGPVLFDLDLDIEGRRMPTFFTTPALVAKKSFYSDLVDAGVDNIDVYPCVITLPETGEKNSEYQVLNIVGLCSCANMDASEYSTLGPSIHIIDELVIDRQRLPDALMFRLAEDSGKIIISDPLYRFLSRRSYGDIFFEKIRVQ